MSDAVLRGGLIGCGYVSASHLSGWKQQRQAEIVCVCDLDESRAERAAERFGIRHWCSAAERMIEDHPLDFIEICTRPDSHLALVSLAAEAGLSILCQKPVAGDLATIDRMIKVCAKHDVRLMVHENWRFRPWYVRLAEVVRAGVVGRATRVRLNIHDDRCIAPGGLDNQPYFAEMPRFMLLEMGPHAVDVARQLLGDPVSVYAVLSKASNVCGEDAAHLVLRYEDGAAAFLDMCWATPCCPGDHVPWGLYETVVEGDRGTIRTTGDGQLLLQRPGQPSQAVAVPSGDDPRIGSYAAAQRHFIDCLKTGNPFLTGIEDNRRAMQIIFAGYESAATGQAVRLTD